MELQRIGHDTSQQPTAIVTRVEDVDGEPADGTALLYIAQADQVIISPARLPTTLKTNLGQFKQLLRCEYDESWPGLLPG